MRLINNIVFTIQNFLFALVMPHFWIMLHKYDPRSEFIARQIIENPKLANPHKIYMIDLLDFEIDYNMEDKMIVCNLGCDVGRGEYTLWVGNYPYSYGVDKGKRYGRPSRITIYKLKKVIDQQIKLMRYNTSVRKKLGW